MTVLAMKMWLNHMIRRIYIIILREFLKAIKVIELESVREECLKYDIIAIDEG